MDRALARLRAGLSSLSPDFAPPDLQVSAPWRQSRAVGAVMGLFATTCRLVTGPALVRSLVLFYRYTITFGGYPDTGYGLRHTDRMDTCNSALSPFTRSYSASCQLFPVTTPSACLLTRSCISALQRTTRHRSCSPTRLAGSVRSEPRHTSQCPRLRDQGVLPVCHRLSHHAIRLTRPLHRR